MPIKTYLLGRKAKAYFNTDNKLIGGVPGDDPGNETPDELVKAWLDDEATIVAGNLTSVSLNMDSEYADGTTRETAESGFGSQIPVLRGGSVSFQARWQPNDPAAVTNSFAKLLLASWQADLPMGMIFLDQDKNPEIIANGGSDKEIQGLVANFNVSISKTEDLRDIQRLTVALTIADSGLWYTEKVDAV